MSNPVELDRALIESERRRIARLVSDVALQSDPFPHAEIADFFSPEMYALVCRALRDEQPDEIGNYQLTRGYGKLRKVLYFDSVLPNSEARHAEFWKRFSKWFLFNPEITLPLLHRFAPLTPYGSGERFREQPGRLTLQAVRDFEGFALRPHTDTCGKLMTIIVYLPDVSEAPSEGTTIYRPLDPDKRCRFGNVQHDRKDFEAVKSVPYVANRALLFPRTEQSFHGVEKLARPGERNLLQYSIQRVQPPRDIYPDHP